MRASRGACRRSRSIKRHTKATSIASGTMLTKSSRLPVIDFGPDWNVALIPGAEFLKKIKNEFDVSQQYVTE